MSNKIQQVNLNNQIQKRAIKKEEKKLVSNAVEKDPSKTEYLKMASILFSGALIACGGMGLASKAYSKFSNDFLLGSRIRRSEISQELFAFLERYSKEHKNKFTRAQVLKLNETLTEENIPIFKALLKTNIARFIENDEIVSIVDAINSKNSKHILNVAKKYDNIWEYRNGDIAKTLQSITEDNSEFVNMILSKTERPGYREPKVKIADKIIGHLEKITKDNVEAYRLVENLRKDGKYSSFKLDEIDDLVEVFKKGQNDEVLEYLSSLKATNGVDYRFSGKDLKEILQNAQNDFIDLYKACVKSCKDDAKDIIPKINKDNVKTLDYLINLKDGDRFFFDYPKKLIEASDKIDDKYLDIYKSLDLGSLYKGCESGEIVTLIESVNKDTAGFIKTYFPKIKSDDLYFIKTLNAEKVAFAEKFIKYSGTNDIKANDNMVLLKRIFNAAENKPEKAPELYAELSKAMENEQKMDYFDWGKIIDKFSN